MKTVVLFSGGVDSTVLLAESVRQGDEPLALSFDYGQTHRRELEAAKLIAAHYEVDWELVTLNLGGSALTGHGEIPAGHAESVDATYVPGRNIVMIAIGASIAEQVGAAAVLIGANADDAAGYPDCRPKFISAMWDAVALGTARGISVGAPFAPASKADIIAYGRELKVPLHLTWSCYRGAEVPCGRCGACVANNRAGLV